MSVTVVYKLLLTLIHKHVKLL